LGWEVYRDTRTPVGVGSIKNRMIEAYRTQRRTPDAFGPREPVSSSPQYIRSDHDLKGATPDEYRPSPEPIETRRMLEAFAWLEWLRDFEDSLPANQQHTPRLAVVISRWAATRARARAGNIETLCMEFGFDRRALFSRIDRAATMIIGQPSLHKMAA
jgi:hypothetical protein